MNVRVTHFHNVAGVATTLAKYQRKQGDHASVLVTGNHPFGYPGETSYEDFIEMGISVVDTLQPEAKDMSPVHLKQRFGGRMSFHGCISTAGVVARGTVEETVAVVRETLDVMMPGGGYALSPTHLLQDNTPTANAVALYETAKTHGRYR